MQVQDAPDSPGDRAGDHDKEPDQRKAMAAAAYDQQKHTKDGGDNESEHKACQ